MNFDFAKQINPYLEKLAFENAISLAEAELKKLPFSDYHSIIGKSLLSQAISLASWINDFYELVSKKMAIKSLYFELNEFDINTDVWYVDAFAFTKDGGLNPVEMDWLCYADADAQSEMDSVFLLEGLEELQSAFEIEELDTEYLQDARDWCEQIIIARYMQLMRTAHLIAEQNGYSWAATPIYFTEHEYDFILKSEN